MTAPYPMAEEAGSDWIEWTGGECPLPADTLVSVQLRHETREHACNPADIAPASDWDWADTGEDWNLIAYRVVRT